MSGTPPYISNQDQLQHIIDNQHEASNALVVAATALAAQASKTIEVHDVSTGRPVTFIVSNIVSISKNISGQAVIGQPPGTTTTVESYEVVKALLGG